MRVLLFFPLLLPLLISCDNGISFPDPALDACVRNSSSITDESHLTQADLDKITILACGEDDPGYEENGISNLSGIEQLTNLQNLNLYKSKVYNIEPLSRLKKLRELSITSEKKIYSYEPLTQLALTFLGIHEIGLEDISFLADIPTLQEVDLDRNNIPDISPIKQLPQLVSVDFTYNKISSLEAIANHPNITKFQKVAVSYNCIDCAAEKEYRDLIKEKNPGLTVFCSSEEQLLSENCEE